MAEFNINNLVLDDNSFEVLPDGDYRFRVAFHEIGFAQSEKLPPNTQQVACYLEIPFRQDGEIKTVKVRNNLNVYQKALFAIRQFADCIGLTPEKGKAKIDLESMDGKTGVCSITTRESKAGNEYNNVGVFYPPSKVPAVTANDDAWKEWYDLDIPFDI